jgi:hypothetical protein
MKLLSKHGKFTGMVEIGSLWIFKHAKPKLIVRVFEADKKSGIIYGLRRAVAGHMTSTISGFIENYTLYKSKEDKNGNGPSENRQ